VLEGRRQVRRSWWSPGLVDEMFGTNAYMDQGALHALLGEAPTA
jgi:hypothetical protein